MVDPAQEKQLPTSSHCVFKARTPKVVSLKVSPNVPLAWPKP